MHYTPPSFGGETTGKERHSSRISIYTRNHRGGDGEREIETFLAEEHGTISSSEWREDRRYCETRRFLTRTPAKGSTVGKNEFTEREIDWIIRENGLEKDY